MTDYNFDSAVYYHEGKFPPCNLDFARIVRPLSRTADALARYDSQLRQIPNKDLLLAPLRNREAVVTSRIEGTVATLDEVLQIQADADDDTHSEAPTSYRQEALEVYSYTRAIMHAEHLMQTGLPICSRLVREAHARLLFWGRGADKTPGHFKTDQNYIIDRNGRQILFVPIDAQKLEPGIAKLEQYINDPEIDPLIQTAVSHLEFEALHPFRDGNGRIGRMLITLNLWDKKRIATPSFYISDCLEERRDEYIDRLRGVSATGEWTDWIEFFLTVVQRQSEKNLLITQSVLDLYNDMKGRFQHLLRSQWHIAALDYMFARGVFRNSAFTAKSGIPSQTAHRITKALLEAGILQTVVPAAGRRSALYAFKALLDVVR